jgi:hypothetical protein
MLLGCCPLNPHHDLHDSIEGLVAHAGIPDSVQAKVLGKLLDDKEVR